MRFMTEENMFELMRRTKLDPGTILNVLSALDQMMETDKEHDDVR